MNVERALISKIIEDQDLSLVHEAAITKDFFDKTHAEIFEWINEYWRDEGAVPTSRVVKDSYPTFRMERDIEESLDWLVRRLQQQRKRELVYDILASSHEAMGSQRGQDKAVEIMSEGLERLSTIIPSLTEERLAETWKERIAWYRELSETKDELAGLPTGFPAIDEATNGLQAEQLVTIIGQAKAGKSWIALRVAKEVSDLGLMPMFVSFEMSADEQAARFDAMCLECDSTNIMTGRTTSLQRKRLKSLWQERERLGQDIMISHDVHALTTVNGLAAKIETTRPDLVIVDGAYLMDVEGERENERLTNLTRSLKRLAQKRQIPIVVTTQALASKTRRGGRLDQNSAGYTSSFQQDSDVLLGIEKPDDDDGTMILRILASRNSGLRSIEIGVDWSMSTFKELGDALDDADFD